MPNEFEVKNFQGLVTSNRNPGISNAQALKNFDLRRISGDLQVRSAYSLKYDAPSDSRLTSISSLSFANLYIPDVGGGREVIAYFSKGTLSAEAVGSTYTLPASINILTVWAIPYWDGSNWIYAWNWVNECRLTKIYNVDPSSVGDRYKIELDFTDATLITNEGLNNWTIVNTSRNESAKIVKTYPGTGGKVAVEITNNTHAWTVQDVIVLMKNYIPYSYLTSLYNVTASDIVFHNVLDDLRIGFGGQSGRIGLSLGYRKSFLSINDIRTKTYTSTELQSFAKIDGLVLDVYNTIGTESNIQLSAVNVGTGTLAAGTYSFRLTALLDNFNEIMIAENQIDITANTDIQAVPRLRAGVENKRITKLKLYWSDDGELFYYFGEYSVRENSYNKKEFSISPDGFITYDGVNPELHTGSNAIMPSDTDVNTSTGWTITNPSYSIVGDAAALNLSSVARGIYALKFWDLSDVWGFGTFNGISYNINAVEKQTTYVISFQSIASSNLTIIIKHTDNDDYSANEVYRALTTSWGTYTAEITTKGNPKDLIIGAYLKTGDWIAIDDISIKKKGANISITQTTAEKVYEMNDELGYVPTLNVVKSWDYAIVNAGRTYLINPYIDKRYLNKIFFSPISGGSEYQYDVLSGSNYFNVENFSGSDLLAIEKLPNLDLLLLKTNAVQRLNTLTGQLVDVELGKGLSSKHGVVNFGGRVIWSGNNDVNLSDGNTVKGILRDTIREEYRALANKNLFVAVREEKNNSYRLKTDTKEYVLTDRGWLTEVRADMPEKYVVLKDGSVLFLNSGKIYEENPNMFMDKGTAAISFQWKSVPFDITLLGEGFKENERFHIRSLWVSYTSGTDFSVNVYLDGNLFQTITIKGGNDYAWQRLKVGSVARKIELEITGQTSGASGNIIIRSIGFQWRKAPIGRFG